MKRSHGGYSKHSRRFTAKKRLPVSKHLSKFVVGDRLRLVFNPRFKKGRPNTLRFNNRFVEVVGLRGRSYEVILKDGGKSKLLLVSNVHLQKV